MTTHADENRQLLDPPKPRKRRRWKRKVLLVFLFAIGGVLILLQTPVAGAIVRPILASQTGMNIETGPITVSPLGNVTIDRARFLAPGLPGQAGEVLGVDRISARIDSKYGCFNSCRARGRESRGAMQRRRSRRARATARARGPRGARRG